uniref:Uncharacterized protein n=1 Tax=Plectus sambesii TaxID=2011161 RepID=A0A914ULZ1_9BILA
MVRNVRGYTMLAAVSVFLFVCFVLYSSLESSNIRKKEFYEHGKVEVDRLESKLMMLERDLEKNEKLIKDIRGSIGKVVNGGGPKPGVAADSKEDNDRR